MKIFHLLILAFIFRIALSFFIYHPDLTNHIDWGIRFWDYGPLKFYSQNVWSFTWPNQPPGTMYLFAGVRKLFEFIFAIFWFLNVSLPFFPSGIITFLADNLYASLLKLPSILADLGIAYLIYKIFKEEGKEKLGKIGAALFLFNPIIWYNSTIWGQTDAVINFLALLAFVLLLKKKLLPAVVFLFLSFYIKASLLIFLPLFAIIILRQKYKFGQIIYSGIIALSIIGLLTLPFSGGEPFGWLLKLYQDKVFTEQLHLITANAFNIWAAIATINATPNTLPLGPFTYELWGQVLFALSFFPMLYMVWKKQDNLSVFSALALTSFASFMFLTNIHERYLYPLFPAFTIIAAHNRKLLWVYITISLISIINLYNFWWTPRVELFIDVLSFQERLLPRILGAFSLVLFAILYYSLFKVPRIKKSSA